MADDAARVAPHLYKVIFENERARVLEVTMQPGDRSDLHAHPDYVVHIVSGGTVKFTAPSGDEVEAELPTGATIWRDAETHATTNVGSTVIHGLFFEPK